jgi:hypothetical protein
MCFSRRRMAWPVRLIPLGESQYICHSGHCGAYGADGATGSVRQVRNVPVVGVVVLAFLFEIVVAVSTVQGVLVLLRRLLLLLPSLHFLMTANGPDDRVISTVDRTIVF